MNLFDIVVILLLLLGAIAGARAGFLGPVGGLAGAVGGFALALLLAAALRPTLAEIGQPTRALVTLLGLGALVLTGEALGAAAGATMSRALRAGWMRPVDLVGGAVVGAAHVVLLVWLAGGMVAAGMAPSLAPAARDSVALRAIDTRLPPPGIVAGRLLALLAGTDLPLLFGGLEPAPAPPVDLPDDAQVRALAESALASAARVTSVGCSPGLSVGSGFFVGVAHVVTNAHVVAGSTETTVAFGSRTFAATVVLFDPQADLALLHVPGANAPALRLSGSPPQRGQAAAALGYPGGGPLSVAPAAITATYDIDGPDIYGEGRGERSVVEMRASIARGNSGGPLVVEPGVAGGVVFGASRTDAGVAYAIAAPQAAARIGPALGATASVSTGACR